MSNPFANVTDSGNTMFAGYVGQVVDCLAIKGTFNVQVTWMVGLESPELFPQIQGGSQTVRLAVEDGWEPSSDGSKLVFPGRADKKMGKRSEYGIFLERLKNGEMENFTAFVDAWGDRSPFDMTAWRGFSFLWDEIEWSYGGYERGDDDLPIEIDGKKVFNPKLGTKAKVMPVRFTGLKGAASSNGQLDPINVETLALSDDLKAAVAKNLDAPDYKTFLSVFKGDEFGAVFTAVPNKETYAALQAGTQETF